MVQVENDKMLLELTTKQAELMVSILDEKLHSQTPDITNLDILPIWSRLQSYLAEERKMLNKR